MSASATILSWITAEVDQALTYVANVRNKFDGKLSPHDAWKSLLRILIASNDFIYVD